MGKPKIKKSIDNLSPEEFKVHLTAGNLLLHDKTPGYEKRFKSWAKSTQGEHLTNLVSALLSALAYQTITKQGNVDHLRGQADGIILISEWIQQYASETKIINAEEED